MKYLSEKGGMLTSVHDWKPVTAEQFATLLHRYATVCSADENGEHGNEGMAGVWPHAYKLDRVSTATIWYMPKGGKAPNPTSSPVLLTITRNDGKIICFESLSYGLEELTVGEAIKGVGDAIAGKFKIRVPDDGIQRIETGLHFRTRPRPVIFPPVPEDEWLEIDQYPKDYAPTVLLEDESGEKVGRGGQFVNGTWRSDTGSEIDFVPARFAYLPAQDPNRCRVCFKPIGKVHVFGCPQVTQGFNGNRMNIAVTLADTPPSEPAVPLKPTLGARLEALRKIGYLINKETAGWYWIYNNPVGSNPMTGTYRYSSQEEAIEDAEAHFRSGATKAV